MIRLTEAWFEFDGKRSDSMGILLSQMPVREHPAARYTGFTVKGRSGILPDGGVASVVLSLADIGTRRLLHPIPDDARNRNIALGVGK